MVGYNIPYVCPSWSYHCFVCARCTKSAHTYEYHRCNVYRINYMCIYVSACTAIISTLYVLTYIHKFYLGLSLLYAFKSSNYSFRKFFLNPPIILKIIPTKIDLLTIIHANLLINTKKIIYSYK